MTQQRGVALPLLLDVIDRLAIRYIKDRVVFKHRDARIAALFRGTNLNFATIGVRGNSSLAIANLDGDPDVEVWSIDEKRNLVRVHADE